MESSTNKDWDVVVVGAGAAGLMAAAIAAERGKRTLLVEMDSQRPAFTPIFGCEPAYEPREVMPRLDICNLTWDKALEDFIVSLVPSRRVMGLVLQNRMVTRFLDFVPGSQEIVTLSALGQHVAPSGQSPKYDVVVADLSELVHDA